MADHKPKQDSTAKRYTKPFVRTLYNIWDNVFDFFTVFVGSIDVVSDILVAAEFYYNGWTVPFMMCIFVLFLSNVAYVGIVVEVDWKDHFEGEIPWLDKRPKWMKCLLLFPIAQLIPMITWISTTFYPNEHVKTKKAEAQKKKNADDDDDPLALLAVSSALRMITHRYFLMEALIESVPQSVIQLMAITYHNDAASFVQVSSLLLSVVCIVSKGYVYTDSFQVVIAITKFCLLGSDILSYFFAAATLFSLPPTTTWMGLPTTYLGFTWLSLATLFGIALYGVCIANWIINVVDWYFGKEGDKPDTEKVHSVITKAARRALMDLLGEFAKFISGQLIKCSLVFCGVMNEHEPSFDDRLQHQNLNKWLQLQSSEEWVPKLRHVYSQLAHKMKQLHGKDKVLGDWCDTIQPVIHQRKKSSSRWILSMWAVQHRTPENNQPGKEKETSSHSNKQNPQQDGKKNIIPKRVRDICNPDFLPIVIWVSLMIPYNTLHTLFVTMSNQWNDYPALAKGLLILNLTFFSGFVIAAFFCWPLICYVGTLRWTRVGGIRKHMHDTFTKEWLHETMLGYYDFPSLPLLTCTLQDSGIPYDIIFCISEFVDKVDIKASIYYKIYCNDILNYSHRLHQSSLAKTRKAAFKWVTGLMQERRGKALKRTQRAGKEKEDRKQQKKIQNKPLVEKPGVTFSEGVSVTSLLRKRKKQQRLWFW